MPSWKFRLPQAKLVTKDKPPQLHIDQRKHKVALTLPFASTASCGNTKGVVLDSAAAELSPEFPQQCMHLDSILYTMEILDHLHCTPIQLSRQPSYPRSPPLHCPRVQALTASQMGSLSEENTVGRHLPLPQILLQVLHMRQDSQVLWLIPVWESWQICSLLKNNSKVVPTISNVILLNY